MWPNCLRSAPSGVFRPRGSSSRGLPPPDWIQGKDTKSSILRQQLTLPETTEAGQNDHLWTGSGGRFSGDQKWPDSKCPRGRIIFLLLILKNDWESWQQHTLLEGKPPHKVDRIVYAAIHGVCSVLCQAQGFGRGYASPAKTVPAHNSQSIEL